MEENIISNDLPINDETVLTDENSLLSDQNSVLSSEDIESISQNLLDKLVEQSVQNSEDSEEQSEEISDEQNTQIDYTEQLFDLDNSVDILRSDIASVRQSLALQETTLETLPNDIREQFDDIIQFQYLTFSLIFGILVAIIFFQGLKK